MIEGNYTLLWRKLWWGMWVVALKVGWNKDLFLKKYWRRWTMPFDQNISFTPPSQFFCIVPATKIVNHCKVLCNSHYFNYNSLLMVSSWGVSKLFSILHWLLLWTFHVDILWSLYHGTDSTYTEQEKWVRKCFSFYIPLKSLLDRALQQNTLGRTTWWSSEA